MFRRSTGKSKGLEVNLDRSGLRILRPTQDGLSYWDLESQEVILKSLGDFLPRVTLLADGQTALFRLIRDKKEMCFNSEPVGERGVGEEEVYLLERGLSELEGLLEDPAIDPNARHLLANFKLPDPDKLPEFYRLSAGRLIIIWGCEAQSEDTIPAKIALAKLIVDSKWKVWLRRYWKWLLWGGLGIIALVALLLLLSKCSADETEAGNAETEGEPIAASAPATEGNRSIISRTDKPYDPLAATDPVASGSEENRSVVTEDNATFIARTDERDLTVVVASDSGGNGSIPPVGNGQAGPSNATTDPVASGSEENRSLATEGNTSIIARTDDRIPLDVVAPDSDENGSGKAGGNGQTASPSGSGDPSASTVAENDTNAPANPNPIGSPPGLTEPSETVSDASDPNRPITYPSDFNSSENAQSPAEGSSHSDSPNRVKSDDPSASILAGKGTNIPENHNPELRKVLRITSGAAVVENDMVKGSISVIPPPGKSLTDIRWKFASSNAWQDLPQSAGKESVTLIRKPERLRVVVQATMMPDRKKVWGEATLSLGIKKEVIFEVE